MEVELRNEESVRTSRSIYKQNSVNALTTNEHDPIFVLAILLDLQYQLVLSIEQIASARTELLRKMKGIKQDNLNSPSE